MFEQVTQRSRWRTFWPEVSDLDGAKEAIKLGYGACFVLAGLNWGKLRACRRSNQRLKIAPGFGATLHCSVRWWAQAPGPCRQFLAGTNCIAPAALTRTVCSIRASEYSLGLARVRESER